MHSRQQWRLASIVPPTTPGRHYQDASLHNGLVPPIRLWFLPSRANHDRNKPGQPSLRQHIRRSFSSQSQVLLLATLPTFLISANTLHNMRSSFLALLALWLLGTYYVLAQNMPKAVSELAEAEALWSAVHSENMLAGVFSTANRFHLNLDHWHSFLKDRGAAIFMEE